MLFFVKYLCKIKKVGSNAQKKYIYIKKDWY